MDLNDLKNYIKGKIKIYPSLAEEIKDLYQLCRDEIEAGESQSNEINLCYNDIKNLIEEHNE